eukprot:3830985-Pyramimonas_sp.AAC.1
MAPKAPRRLPRAPQERPTRPQRSSQETPTRTQEAPKKTQDGSNSEKAKKTQTIDFPQVLDGSGIQEGPQRRFEAL